MFGGLFDSDDRKVREEQLASICAIQAVLIRERLTTEAELRELKEKYAQELAEHSAKRTREYLESLRQKKEQGNG